MKLNVKQEKKNHKYNELKGTVSKSKVTINEKVQQTKQIFQYKLIKKFGYLTNKIRRKLSDKKGHKR